MFRDAITLNSKTLTINGDIWAGAFEWIIGTGTLAGSPGVQFWDPTWDASTVTTSVTPSYKQIQFGTTNHETELIVNSGAQFTALGNSIFNAVSDFNNTVTWSKGGDLASGDQLILNASGNYYDVTGTSTINSISSAGIGTVLKLHFDGAATITNSADIELAANGDITTVAGDELEFVEYDTGQWRQTVTAGELPYAAGSTTLSIPTLHDPYSHTGNTTPTRKAVRFRFSRAGTVRFNFDLKISNAIYTASGGVYINGVLSGSWQQTTSTSYVNKTLDVVVAKGDYADLYIWTNNSGSTVSARNWAVLVATPRPGVLWEADITLDILNGPGL
jgi:hypothetical protein